MICLRVFGAYTFRLTRRHSTALLIASFIVTITIILQLYAHRHQENPHKNSIIIGDFEYKPGQFLKGQQPNYNHTYCQFNFGLPEGLVPGSYRVNTPPEAGNKSHYRVIYNAIKSMEFANARNYDAVTYVTQATPEFIFHIVEIARYWEGPISLSIYVPDYDFAIAMQILNQLCHCYPGMSKVTIHLFFPIANPPKMIRDPMITTTFAPTTSNVTMEEITRIKMENYKKLNGKARAEYITKVRVDKIQRMMSRIPTKRTTAPYLTFNDCSGLDSYDIPTYRREFNLIYPINVGRNTARRATKTTYFIVTDIEMVPSAGLAPKFLSMLKTLIGNQKFGNNGVIDKTVFVVPVFEVEKGEEMPRDKQTLLRLIASNRAMYFHQKQCSHCQRFPGMQTWLMRTPRDIIEPMYFARREYPYHRWEPLYFGSNNEPWYSEMLSWEGRQDKMTQMMELCLLQYDFTVLDGCYLIHFPQVFKIKRNAINAEILRRTVISNWYRYYALNVMYKEKYKIFNDEHRNVTNKKCYVLFGYI